jgi:ribonuclease G
LPLSWFRRKTDRPAAPVTAAAPARPVIIQTEPVAPAPDGAGGAETEAQKRKRRRGSRGGKGRKKPATASADGAAAETAETAAMTDKPAAAKQPTAEKRERQQPERKQPRASSGSRSSTRRRQPPKRAPLPAAKRELLVSVDLGEQRVAVLEDDRVAEVYLERPDRRSIAGNIYLGTVDNVLPGMEAAFVEIGLEKNGFLYVDEIVRPELEGKRHGKKIQDLIQRGQSVLVQAVKDPMKTKGARLTMEISLPGRFVVFVPEGEGLGVSRRLADDERARLKDVIKGLNVKTGGVIVRTAAERASAEDVERDLVFLQRLWKTIQTQAKGATAPALIYQEAELPLRVTRDLFTGDFERALVDNDIAYKRIVGYLRKTSPHMVERVVRYKEKAPLFEATGVDAEIRSTLNRRVDLPSGGYLIFDYAEAFTVVDVNTGRFVGSRSKTSSARLEDTITKNNLEAVKEVVRQLRLRDIGGIIVIDFIDMANPSNRAAVEEALRTELERDRTKTYVVEISPLGLVEMTRQNVTDGPREILTKKCPTCAGDGIVYSEASAAIDVERRLRALAAGSRVQAFQVELNPKVAALAIGAGAERLAELEAQTKKRFFIVTKDGVHTDHLAVLAEGSVAKLQPSAALEQDAELELKLVEVDRYDSNAGVGKVGDLDVVVAGAARLVGKKVKAKVVRVLDGVAYAVQAGVKPAGDSPITAEAEAEKPTRKPPVRKGLAAALAAPGEPDEEYDEEPAEEYDEEPAAGEDEEPVEEEDETENLTGLETGEAETGEAAVDGEAPPLKKKTRRGSRGGRNRKRKPTIHVPGGDLGNGAGTRPAEPAQSVEEPVAEEPQADMAAEEEPAVNGDSEGPAAPPKKKTRRGSRGGKNRRKPVAREEGAEQNGDAPPAAAVPAANGGPSAATKERPAPSEEQPAGYVPMSEWLDDFGD